MFIFVAAFALGSIQYNLYKDSEGRHYRFKRLKDGWMFSDDKMSVYLCTENFNIAIALAEVLVKQREQDEKQRAQQQLLDFEPD